MLEECQSSIFADDTAVLSSEIYASDIVANLQKSLDVVIGYFNKWKIVVNASKTQAIYFTRKRKDCYLPNSNIKIGGVDVPWESKVKYLGVILDRKIIFNDHISYTINKVNTTIKILYPFINRKSKLSIENKLIMLKVIFHAIIFYAAPVWHDTADCHIKRLQVCQNKILKMMYDLPYHYSTSRLHSKHNILLVKDKIFDLKEKFYEKCSYSLYDHIRSLCS